MRVRILAAVIIAFAAVACNDGTAPTSVAVRSPLALGAPPAELVDGGHNGNSEFLFLPPLSRHHGRLPSKLDRTAEPVVVICQLATDRTQCDPVVDPVVEFTTAKGHGRSERIRLSGDHFSVDWQTRRFHLKPSKFYRICVSIGDHALGHADVAIVKHGRGRDNDEGDFPLQRGSPLAIEFWIGKGALDPDQPADAGCGGGGGAVPGTISGKVSDPWVRVDPTRVASGYTVYLLDPTGTTEIAHTSTDGTGTYTFTSASGQFMAGKSYLVCEANPIPWPNAPPANGPPAGYPDNATEDTPNVNTNPVIRGLCNASFNNGTPGGLAMWGYLVKAPENGAGIAGGDFKNTAEF